MDQMQDAEQIVVDWLTAISLRLDANHAVLDLIEKTLKKAKIELEYARFSSPYLIKLTSFLIKINDNKTSRILNKNLKLIGLKKDKDILKNITKSIEKNYLQNITLRINKIFELDSYLEEVGENIEISKYVIHILDNLKKCTESEIKIDEYYQNYLKNSFGVEYSVDEGKYEK